MRKQEGLSLFYLVSFANAMFENSDWQMLIKAWGWSCRPQAKHQTPHQLMVHVTEKGMSQSRSTTVWQGKKAQKYHMLALQSVGRQRLSSQNSVLHRNRCYSNETQSINRDNSSAIGTSEFTEWDIQGKKQPRKPSPSVLVYLHKGGKSRFTLTRTVTPAQNSVRRTTWHKRQVRFHFIAVDADNRCFSNATTLVNQVISAMYQNNTKRADNSIEYLYW